MKIAVTTSIVLFCTALVMFAFFKLSAATDNRDKINLLNLVPVDAKVVLEINSVEEFMDDIEGLDCSKDHHFLHVSRLFSLLKTNFYALKSEGPHGMSRQMNRMLISFHEPDNDKNQVLYCALGVDDYELVQKLIEKSFSTEFPAKETNYKGEIVRIYPMQDGSFLTCYLTPQFVALSFQKRLIEKVIDTSLLKKSLLKDPSFQTNEKSKQLNGPATVYVRLQSLDLGRITHGVNPIDSLVGWMEFDVKMTEQSIYFTGIAHDTDTCSTFINGLRKQRPIEGFLNTPLPFSTFLFTHRAINEWQEMFELTSIQDSETPREEASLVDRHMALLDYFKNYASGEVTTCYFERSDAISQPATVVGFSMVESVKSEKALVKLIKDAPKDVMYSVWEGGKNHWVWLKNRLIYQLPRSSLFAQLTGIAKKDTYTYVAFYAGDLLLADKPVDLLCYMDCIEHGRVLDYATVHEDGMSALSDVYNFMLFSDLEKLFMQHQDYVQLIPSFFTQHASFFQYFKLAAQFTCVDGVISPNLVLLYDKD